MGRGRAPLPARRRRRLHRGPYRARRRPLGWTRRPEHRRLASLRDAGPRERPFASAHRARLQGGPGGPRRPRDVRHRALRTLLRLLSRRGGPPGGDGNGLRGVAALGRHHRGRSLRTGGRMARLRGAGADFASTSAPSSPTPTGRSRTGTSSGSTGTRREGGGTSRKPSASWTGRSSIRAAGSAASSIRPRSRPAPNRRCATRPPTRARVGARSPPTLSQSKLEFLEIVRRHGKTPLEVCGRHRLPRPRHHPRACVVHR